MTRFFNTAGPCDARDHYLLPPEARLPELRALVAQKAYFVVHAPHQSGKTTTLRHAAAALELEVWREGRPDPQPRGLEQLAGYLER